MDLDDYDIVELDCPSTCKPPCGVVHKWRIFNGTKYITHYRLPPPLQPVVVPPGKPTSHASGGSMAKVGYFSSPSSTGNHSITGLGFKPKVIEFIGCKNDGLQTWFFHSSGFADDVGHQNVSTLAGNFSNLWLGDCKFDSCIYLINTGRNIQVKATLVSMDDDGFTLHFTPVNPVFVIRWKAIA